MGFSITSCVLVSIMVICYSIALSEFSHRLRYRRYYDSDSYYSYYYADYYSSKNGVGLGSCLLILAIVQFFVALTSAIYCCNVFCCGSTAPVATVSVEHGFIFQ